MSGGAGQTSSNKLYSAAVPGYTVLSRVPIGQLILPLKGDTAANNRAILFDDVAHDAANNTYSSIALDTSNNITIKTRNHTYTFSDDVNPSIFVDNVQWFGGSTPPFGAGTGVIFSNLVNLGADPVMERASFIRIGDNTIWTICFMLNPTSNSVTSFDFELNEITAMRSTNFVNLYDSCGLGGSSKQQFSIEWFPNAVIGTKRININSGTVDARAGSQEVGITFNLLCN